MGRGATHMAKAFVKIFAVWRILCRCMYILEWWSLLHCFAVAQQPCYILQVFFNGYRPDFLPALAWACTHKCDWWR